MTTDLFHRTELPSFQLFNMSSTTQLRMRAGTGQVPDQARVEQAHPTVALWQSTGGNDG